MTELAAAQETGRRTWRRRLVVGLVLVAVATAGVVALRAYRGLPCAEVVGFDVESRTALTVDDDQPSAGDPVTVTFPEPVSHTGELYLVRDHASCRPGWLLTSRPRDAPPAAGSGDYLSDGRVVGGRKQQDPWVPLGSLGSGTRGVQLSTAPTMTVQVPTGAEPGDYLLCAYAVGPMSCAEVTVD